MKCGEYEIVRAPDGYPGTLYQGRYCYEHHAVYWLAYGVVIQSGEVIHHVNGQKRDNRIENLELKTVSAHAREHGLERGRTMVTLECPECEQSFERERRQTHLVKGGRPSCCSRSCARRRSARTNPNESPWRRSPHGTRRRYQNGCGCFPCREAHNAYMREYRARRRAAS